MYWDEPLNDLLDLPNGGTLDHTSVLPSMSLETAVLPRRNADGLVVPSRMLM